MSRNGMRFLHLTPIFHVWNMKTLLLFFFFIPTYTFLYILNRFVLQFFFFYFSLQYFYLKYMFSSILYQYNHPFFMYFKQICITIFFFLLFFIVFLFKIHVFIVNNIKIGRNNYFIYQFLCLEHDFFILKKKIKKIEGNSRSLH